MSPIRREILNGLLVLVLSTLLSAAIGAFGLKFNLLVWVLIIMPAASAILGYVVFKFLLSSEQRETEWLRRVGTPARLELGLGLPTTIEAVGAMKPGSDLTVVLYFDRDGSPSRSLFYTDKSREQFYASIMQQMKRGVIREYKRLICFDPDVLADDHELQLASSASAKDPELLLRQSESIAGPCWRHRDARFILPQFICELSRSYCTERIRLR